MMPVWDTWGVRVPCTVLELQDCRVTDVKVEERHGHVAMQVGAGSRK